MKEKISIHDEEYIILKKATVTPVEQVKQNTWLNTLLKVLMFILLLLLLFRLLLHLFTTYFPRSTSNTVSNTVEEPQNKEEQTTEQKESLESALKDLQEEAERFITSTDEENLREHFSYFTDETNTFLDEQGEHIQKEGEKIGGIITSLRSIFGRKGSFLSNDKNLGIEANDKDMSVIIPANSQFPIQEFKTYFTRSSYQQKMIFKIYQGNDALTENNDYLGTFIINDLQPIAEVGPRVEVTFFVAKDGMVTFQAKDIVFPEHQVQGYLEEEVSILQKSGEDVEEITKEVQGLSNEIEKYFLEQKTQTQDILDFSVLRVIDGDTFVFFREGEAIRARMIGIDTPETSALRKGYVEPYGAEATAFLSQKIQGKQVRLEYDSSQAQVDIYGRELVYVFLEDENINNTMILEGYAKEYTYDTAYKYQELFKESEKNAQEQKQGIWK